MIADFPEILCIQLKRFSYDRLSRTTTKTRTPIRIDSERILDLSPLHYSRWLGLTNFSLSISSRYRLMAVCLHLSKSTSLARSTDGHYVCLYRSEHSRWFLTDDERNTEIHQIADVFQSPYVTENSYLVFFERCGWFVMESFGFSSSYLFWTFSWSLGVLQLWISSRFLTCITIIIQWNSTDGAFVRIVDLRSTLLSSGQCVTDRSSSEICFTRNIQFYSKYPSRSSSIGFSLEDKWTRRICTTGRTYIIHR